MYITDFFKRTMRKSNTAVLIYLALNVFIISVIVHYWCGVYGFLYWQAFIISIVLYIASISVALSPFGEWILRLQNGCKKIKKAEQISFLEPIFKEVYDKARKIDPSIPEDVELFMNDDEAPNAFATGRKTICITEGLLQVPEEQIKATLAHEFGHLAHKDTDLILVVSVGNFFVTMFILLLKFASVLMSIFSKLTAVILGNSDLDFMSDIFRWTNDVLIAGFEWLWTWIGIALVMKSSRKNEYEADEFAYDLGFGNELCALLDNISGSKAKGLFAALASSHPEKDERIANLQKLGATYKKEI